MSKLHINIPFIDAIVGMPAYGKFLKEILSNKRKLEDIGEVKMSMESSELIKTMTENMPPKLRDPGSFCIPITLGEATYDALCDLGESVSIIPLALCKAVGLGEPRPVKITLYMADRSTTKPVGILEDIPVKLGKFYIPIDFVVLDIPADYPVPIILGRPFLATSGCMVDCKNGQLSFHIGEEKIEFILSSLIKEPALKDDAFEILMKKSL